MRYFDLFCGIGGFHKVMKPYGQLIASCDNNNIAKQAYKALHGHDVKYNDVRKIDFDTFPDFDVLCAGFPCQPFSYSGRRRGFEDVVSGD